MKALPRILVIDDVYGKEGKERINFCLRLGLDNPNSKTNINDPIAEAIFCSGQIETNSKVVNDLDGTLKIIRNGWETFPRWALILLDLHFDTGSREDRRPENYFGLTILKELYKSELLKDIPVVILSAMERSRIEQEFADHGALDFVDKTEMNREILANLLFTHGLLEADKSIGRSISFLKCLREARRRAVAGNENILILGETGTGKELLAEYIHQQSGRKGPFNPLFTQGVPETLIEDRLFGHVKGAFDTAQSNQAGAAEMADNGTLFIDEFGNMPSSIQEKLLRLLDKNTREIQRLGSQEWKKLDLLVVMATNKQDILSGTGFRVDLLFRAKSSNPIFLPPLRQRQEDIIPLTEFFIKKFETTFAAHPRAISNKAKDILHAYHWPGNIRELESVIENAVYNYKGLQILSANHLDIRRIPEKEQIAASIPKKKESKEFPVEIAISADNLIELIETFGNFNFTHAPKKELKGKLPKLQDSYARLMARYLCAALKETLSYSSKDSDGEISYHPAMKLITDDFTMKATPARRLLNSLLKISPNAIIDLLESEPILKEVIVLCGDDKLKRSLKISSQKKSEDKLGTS
jgi:DNA-binding NtrC family response regulator